MNILADIKQTLTPLGIPLETISSFTSMALQARKIAVTCKPLFHQERSATTVPVQPSATKLPSAS